MKKTLLFGTVCLMALATILTQSCEKVGSNGNNNGDQGDEEIQSGYVDLGLESGTKWNSVNETNPNDNYGFYTFDEAIAKFDSALPTKEQWKELISDCQWTYDNTKKGYKVVGSNNKSIFLPAAGYRRCAADGGGVEQVGTYCLYWSSTPNDTVPSHSWDFYSYADQMGTGYCAWCGGLSVRLVQK